MKKLHNEDKAVPHKIILNEETLSPITPMNVWPNPYAAKKNVAINPPEAFVTNPSFTI